MERLLDWAEEVLTHAKRVSEAAEVFCTSSRETSVNFQANRLKQAEGKESTGVVLRIIREGRIGLSVAAGLEDVRTLVDMAVETSQFGPPAKLELPSLKAYPQVEVFDPRVDEVKPEEMVELGAELIARVREHTPEVLCEVEVSRGVVSTLILNSRGGRVSYPKSVFGLALGGTLIRDTDMLFVGDSESSCHSLRESGKLAGLVIEQLELARNEAKAPTRPLPVIFTPRAVASTLIAPLALAFNGKMVLEGASPLRDRQGERAFDPRLSLWDDATMVYRPHSRPSDDEGIPSQRTTLIEEGVIANYFYDLQTAALAGVSSTGNGSRARGGMPAPGISSLSISEGETSFAEMVQDMKEGLVIERLMGAEQGNLLGGEFGGNVLLGYKVEGGEMVGRVKDTMVSGNVYEILKDLVAIGREATWVGGFVKAPPLYCRSLSVATSR